MDDIHGKIASIFKEYDEKDQQKSKVLKTSLVRHDCERSQASFLTG
jgi:hypothetical protein